MEWLFFSSINILLFALRKLTKFSIFLALKHIPIMGLTDITAFKQKQTKKGALLKFCSCRLPPSFLSCQLMFRLFNVSKWWKLAKFLRDQAKNIQDRNTFIKPKICCLAFLKTYSLRVIFEVLTHLEYFKKIDEQRKVKLHTHIHIPLHTPPPPPPHKNSVHPNWCQYDLRKQNAAPTPISFSQVLGLNHLTPLRKTSVMLQPPAPALNAQFKKVL